jgi:hypothetical protein
VREEVRAQAATGGVQPWVGPGPTRVVNGLGTGR